jgi:hypothetical protein
LYNQSWWHGWSEAVVMGVPVKHPWFTDHPLLAYYVRQITACFGLQFSVSPIVISKPSVSDV